MRLSEELHEEALDCACSQITMALASRLEKYSKEADQLETKIRTLQQKLAELHCERVLQTLRDIEEDDKKPEDEKLFLREHLQPELDQLRRLILRPRRSY